MEKHRLKCLLVKANELPEVYDIPNTLKAQQKAVNGYIEVCYILEDEEVCIICNEEGKMNGSLPNRDIGYDVIFDNFLIVGNDIEHGDFVSLTDEQIKKYQERFNEKSIQATNDKINNLGMDL